MIVGVGAVFGVRDQATASGRRTCSLTRNDSPLHHLLQTVLNASIYRHSRRRAAERPPWAVHAHSLVAYQGTMWEYRRKDSRGPYMSPARSTSWLAAHRTAPPSGRETRGVSPSVCAVTSLWLLIYPHLHPVPLWAFIVVSVLLQTESSRESSRPPRSCPRVPKPADRGRSCPSPSLQQNFWRPSPP